MVLPFFYCECDLRELVTVFISMARGDLSPPTFLKADSGDSENLDNNLYGGFHFSLCGEGKDINGQKQSLW